MAKDKQPRTPRVAESKGEPPASYNHVAHARRHFATVQLRDYHEIFDSDHIPTVINGGSKHQIKPIRYLQALLVVLGIVMNIVNIVVAFLRTTGQQKGLYLRASEGTFQSARLACLAEDNDESPFCVAYENDIRAVYMGVLVWAELLMVSFTILGAIWQLLALRRADASITSNTNAARWSSVAHGFGYLEDAATSSAVKVLPKIKSAPADAITNYKFMLAQLTENDGVLELGEKLYATGFFVFQMFMVVATGFAGLVALYLKLESLTYLFEIPIGAWRWKRWLTFIGFANQMSGLVPVNKVKKDAFLFFVFTGEDATLEPAEYNAMTEFNGQLYKHIFKACQGWRGFVVALSISSQDLQKVVITEKRKEL